MKIASINPSEFLASNFYLLSYSGIAFLGTSMLIHKNRSKRMKDAKKVRVTEK